MLGVVTCPVVPRLMKKREIAGCTGKARYGFNTALKVREQMMALYPQYRFEAYNCWCCGKWHVGRIYVK